jgi:eukaryotic-like serine/threonine-protein kinase
MAEPMDRLRTALADRYVLEREIGSGGMATVYLARDLRHVRQVAVKVLRPELALTLGPARFLREIQIAAGLTHPHILPLHDSGEAEGFLYYVMPYVEGESLRQRLEREGRLPVAEAARILREVADALAYAHERGVVHRDIKPDNVLLSGRHALVADFGVAKAVSEATGRQSLTTAGVALGTASYMAPEQAVADPQVDHRADLYALGVMAYEMLTGARPFAGGTPQETLVAQVTRTPEPVAVRRPDTPAAFAALVMRCLAKKPSDRPDSALDLLPVLDSVATPSAGITGTGAPVNYPVQQFSWIRLISALSLVVIAGVVALVARARTEFHPVTLGTQSRITDAPGLETDPVISPDGRFIAYAAGPYFTSHIYVRQLSGGPALDLTPSLPGRHTRPRWAPGGGELLFITSDGRTRRINVVSALGGVPRALFERNQAEVITSADWSPDGKRLAYDLGRAIYLKSLADSSTLRLYEGSDPHSVSWSPDGRFIAFVEGGNRLVHGTTSLANTAPSSVLILDVGRKVLATIAPSRGINLSPAWASDGRSLFFISDRDGAKDVYQVAIGSDGSLAGVPMRLTTGLNAHTLALSSNGRRLTFSTLEREANVWSLSLHSRQTETDDSAIQVTSGKQVIERISLSHDGRWLTYTSDRTGNAELYRLRLDQPGAMPEQLTPDSADDFSPAYSPDDRELLFHSFRRGNRALWVMRADGSGSHAITEGSGDDYAGSWSPDGRTVSFVADSAGQLWLGLVSRDASGNWAQPRLLAPGVVGLSDWSPDGTHLAGTVGDALCLIDVRTGRVTPIEPPLSGGSWLYQAIWAADGRSLYYRGREPDGRLTLLEVPLDGRPPFPLVRQRDPSRAGPRNDWTTNGRQFYFTVSQYEGDISVVELKR